MIVFKIEILKGELKIISLLFTIHVMICKNEVEYYVLIRAGRDTLP